MLLIFRVVANLDRSHACRHKIYKKNITFSDRKDAVRRTKQQPPYRPCVKANISECLTDVCFTSETGPWLNALGCPFWPVSDSCTAAIKSYSITSSASASRLGGMVMPRALVWRLISNSNMFCAAVKNVVSFDPSGRSTAGRRCSWSKAK
jgi:hypothetical protein